MEGKKIRINVFLKDQDLVDSFIVKEEEGYTPNYLVLLYHKRLETDKFIKIEKTFYSTDIIRKIEVGYV